MSIYEKSVITIDVNGYATSTYFDSVSAAKVAKSGDTMSGILNMGGYKITGVANPTSNQDAATKHYVDTLGSLKLAKAGDIL